jgi:hypothetical protein
MTALGATTAEDGGSGFGLHAAEKAVGLGAAATVGLKGTLRHETNSSEAGDDLPDLFWLLQQFLIVPYEAGFSQEKSIAEGGRREEGYYSICQIPDEAGANVAGPADTEGLFAHSGAAR